MGRAVVELEYLNTFTDRHGKQRYYFRRNGRRTPLPGIPGSQEFMDAYSACLGGQNPVPALRKAIKPRSIADLVIRYYQSVDYKSIPSPGTRLTYRRILDRFVREHGDRPVSGLTRERIGRLIGDMSDRPGAATVLLKRLRTVVRFAMTMTPPWIDRDPTYKLKAYKSVPFHTWTEDEITTFERRWPEGTKQRLAFALHLYTGQRRSDVHRMTWADYNGRGIRVVQQKTKVKLAVAVHPVLKTLLENTRRQGVAMLLTEYGQPFTVAGYGHWMRGAIKGAGLPLECKTHGLRKAAARRLAEAGCTTKQIAAITGHQSLEEVERYTREADQERLAEDAIRKQAGNI
jgi:integrase